eukprot:scaffold117817_cov48-Attheya_sp.AAC.2
MTAEKGYKMKWGGTAAFFKGKLTPAATLSTSAGTDDTNPASDNTAVIPENITKQRDIRAHQGKRSQTNKTSSGHDINYLQGGVKITVTHTNPTTETSTETTPVPLSQTKSRFVKALLRRKATEAPKKDVPWEVKINLPKERARVEAACYALEARKLLDSVLPDDKYAIDQDSLLGGKREMEGVVRKAFAHAAHSQKLFRYATASSHDMSSLGGGETNKQLEKMKRDSSLAKSLSSADRSVARKTNEVTLASVEPGNQTPVFNREMDFFTTVSASDEETLDELDEIRNTMHNAKAYLKEIVRDFDIMDWDTFELKTDSTIECKLDGPIESFEHTAMEYYGDEQSQSTIEKTLSGLMDTIDDTTTANTTRHSRYYEDKKNESTIRTNESESMVKSRFDRSPDPFDEIVNRSTHYSGDTEGDSVVRRSVGDPFGTLENTFTVETFEANEGNMIFGRSDGSINETFPDRGNYGSRAIRAGVIHSESMDTFETVDPNGFLKELDNRGERLLGDPIIRVFDRTFKENLQDHEDEEAKRLNSIGGRIDKICGAAIQETELIYTGNDCLSRLCIFDTIHEEFMIHNRGYNMSSDNMEDDSVALTSSPVSEDSGLGSECGQEVEAFYHEEHHILERISPERIPDVQFKTSGLKKGKRIVKIRNFTRQNKLLAGIHPRPRGSLKTTRLKNIKRDIFTGKTKSTRTTKSSKSKKNQGNREMTIITTFSDMNDPDLPKAEGIIENEQVIVTDASEVHESPTRDRPRTSRLLQRTELSAEITKGSTLRVTNIPVVEAKNKSSRDIEKCISARNKMPLFDRLLQCGTLCQVLDTTTKLPLM